MPFGDGTGPRGLGPVTGRGAGFCAGYAAPGCANVWPRWAFGGGGRGWRNRYYATGLTGWQRAGTDKRSRRLTYKAHISGGYNLRKRAFFSFKDSGKPCKYWRLLTSEKTALSADGGDN